MTGRFYLKSRCVPRIHLNRKGFESRGSCPMRSNLLFRKSVEPESTENWNETKRKDRSETNIDDFWWTRKWSDQLLSLPSNNYRPQNSNKLTQWDRFNWKSNTCKLLALQTSGTTWSRWLIVLAVISERPLVLWHKCKIPLISKNSSGKFFAIFKRVKSRNCYYWDLNQ